MPNIREIFNTFDLISKPEGFFGKNTYAGLYRGRVEDINDPEQRGRIKVRVHSVHPENTTVPVDHLPWAEALFGDGGENYGDFHIPYRLGDWTYVMFIGGHPDYPVWFGSWYGEDDAGVSEAPEEVRTSQYPHRRIIKTRRGHKIELSDELGEMEIKITDVKGNFVWLDTETDTLKIYWNGNKEEIITGDYNLNVGKNFNVLVQENSTEQVVGDRSSNIGGTETVGVTNDMFHYTGGIIYHNNGGTAQPVTPIPLPEYTVQERKPAFPERIVSLETIANACGCSASKLGNTLSSIASICANGASVESVVSGIETIGPILQTFKDVADTPAKSLEALASVITADASLASAQTNYNKALVELQKLQKNGAPVTASLLNQARDVASNMKDLSLSSVDIPVDITSLNDFLSSAIPNTKAADGLCSTLVAQLTSSVSQAGSILSTLASVKDDLSSIQSGSVINIAKGKLQTQTTRYSISTVESLVSDAVSDMTSVNLNFASALDNTSYISTIVESENNRLLNSLNLLTGSLVEPLQNNVSDVSDYYNMTSKILDSDEEAGITPLLTLLQNQLELPDFSSVRELASEKPQNIMGALSGIMNAIPYNNISEIGNTLSVGFGDFSNIDEVAASHGFGSELLSTISTLKSVNFESALDIANNISALGLSPLKDLSDALIGANEGHLGSVYDIASSIGVSSLDDAVSKISACADASLGEVASKALGCVTPDSILSMADSVASLTETGGYPFDEPIIKLPAGIRVEGLVDG